MEEVREHMVAATITIPTIHCTIFEDNEGAIRGAVSAGKLRIESIDTSNQLADIGTKPLAKDLFMRLRKEITGW
jgi:hypothetical protein